MTYGFHPAAEAEHLETIAWYESRGAGLGARYLVEFERVLTPVCEHLHRHRLEHLPDIRRVHIRGFPFTIIYREVDGQNGSSSMSDAESGPPEWRFAWLTPICT